MSFKKGIPTIGSRGIRFRSRLEAKIAYLMDYLGWSWDYESLDCMGYIPDFIIYFTKQRRLLLEVKGDLVQDCTKIFEKLFRSGYRGDCLFVGSRSPYREKEAIKLDACYVDCKPLTVDQSLGTVEGWSMTGERFHDKRHRVLWQIYDDVYLRFCKICQRIIVSFCDTCVFCKNSDFGDVSMVESIPNEWSRICNQTQWKRPDDSTSSPSKSVQDTSRFHCFSKDELLHSLRSQFNDTGRAVFCERGVWDWYELLRILDSKKAIYICGKEGLCCGDNYVMIESYDEINS